MHSSRQRKTKIITRKKTIITAVTRKKTIIMAITRKKTIIMAVTRKKTGNPAKTAKIRVQEHPLPRLPYRIISL